MYTYVWTFKIEDRPYTLTQPYTMRIYYCLLYFKMLVMVCTIAFGMGVDVPIVVRIGCPPSIEELIQEFGRAGRDGRTAKGKINSMV